MMLALSLLLCVELAARDLGSMGSTYPITEPDMLDAIIAKLKAKEASGELKRLQNEAEQRARRNIENPKPLPIPKATAARSHYFDPSVTVPENIVDDGGNVVVAAGTTRNPLDVVSMVSDLLFIDARDPRQVAFARRYMDASQKPVKTILTGGSFIKLMNEWKVPVYYDQDGSLTRKLGIAAVPSRVTQDGRMLRIDEVAL